jgi:hypothetical protein
MSYLLIGEEMTPVQMLINKIQSHQMLLEYQFESLEKACRQRNFDHVLMTSREVERVGYLVKSFQNFLTQIYEEERMQKLQKEIENESAR